jgi:hypothetical protein
MNSTFVKLAATETIKAYTPEKSADFQVSSRLKDFRPFGDLYALIRFQPDKSIAFVSFRGSDTVRNWFFTNFQAYFSRLAILDPSLITQNTVQIQGAALHRPLGGATHQGFGRAFSWLWYGTDVILEPEPASRKKVRRRFFWHTIVIAILPGAWLIAKVLGLLAIPFHWPLLAAFTLYVLVVNWERGTLEALDRIEIDREHLTPICFQLDRLNEHDTVIFTGHSLGGALATIAFSIYRIWCKSDSSRADNGRLITFGCPRIGDLDFVRKFESDHDSLFLHFVNGGDPVPELPPAQSGTNDQPAIWSRGWLGLIAGTLVAPLWRLYARAYGLKTPGRWSGKNVYYSGGPGAKLWPYDHLSSRYGRLADSLQQNIEIKGDSDA